MNNNKFDLGKSYFYQENRVKESGTQTSQNVRERDSKGAFVSDFF